MRTTYEAYLMLCKNLRCGKQQYLIFDFKFAESKLGCSKEEAALMVIEFIMKYDPRPEKITLFLERSFKKFEKFKSISEASGLSDVLNLKAREA